MSCNCVKPVVTPLWTPIPAYRAPTAIQPGENIDCYMQRAGNTSGLMNDSGAKVPNLINNTTLTSDLNLAVNTTFTLTPGSDRTPTSWTINVNGVDGLAPLTELHFDTTAGTLSGTVSDINTNQSYAVLITALDGTGEIDSRSFNFFPKKAAKGDAITFIIPLDGNVHCTSPFGPRNPPAAGASSIHHGMDFARVDHSIGNILASADGTVVRCGPGTGWGNIIFINHYNDQGTLICATGYAHWSTSYVKVGDKVSQGQKIALEGNVGIGSGAHLHFEMHKGGFKNPVDPAPYLQGALSIANDNSDTQVGPDGTALPTSFVSQNNSNVGMTSAEASNPNSGCPLVLPSDTGLPPVPAGNPPAVPATNIAKVRSSCALPPAQTPSPATVIAAIQQACTEAGYPVGSADATFIQTVATIESGLDPYAKNPTTTCTGLYQMTDALAVVMFGKIGISPTCENRCDPYLATKAMIQWYQSEFITYWNTWISSGKTQIKTNAPLTPTPWSAQYANFTQGEFLYGLIHHDGVGNANAGKDLGGVAYWRKVTT